LAFALDSVSAKVAQIPDQYVAFSSSVIAMYELRAMFFSVKYLDEMYELLQYGLCLILVFIGIELILADLEFDDAELIKTGKHELVAYIMKPMTGYVYLATVAHFAAESSTGTNVNVCTTDDFTKSADALVYYIDPEEEEEEKKIAYPAMLFGAMMCSILTLTIGNNQGMGDVEYGKIYDIYFPPAYLRLFVGPSCSAVEMWRILGRGTKDGGMVVGTIFKPKLGLQPKPFGEACYAFWMGGGFIKK